jgi:tetratricopeptide (TPR) repeat protein
MVIDRLLSSFVVFVLVFVVCPASARAEEPNRYRVDADDVGWIRRQHPHARELFDQGEARLFAGDLERAAELFGHAASEAPQSALASRRQCQALTQLGRHEEAIAACRKAVSNQGSAMDLRAMAAALISGDKLPTTEETGHALMFARRARELMPTEPWGYAAQCDVAARLGDTAMLNDCVADLERVAPAHDETLRAMSFATAIRPGWPTALGWLAIVGLALGTMVHALFQSRRRGWRRSARAGAGSAAVVIALVGLLPARAFADGVDNSANGEERVPRAGSLSKWSVDEKNPEGTVPSPGQRDADPLEYGYHLMDLTDKGEAAMRRGDYAAAAKFYAALAKAVPDVSIAFAKACDAYDALGDREKALASCAAALRRQGVRVGDYAHFARLVLAKPTRLDPSEVDDVDAVIDHLKKDESARPAGFEVQCNLAVRLGDKKRLEECAPALAVIAPGDPKTLFFQWSLALMQRDFPAARRFIEHAKASPMKPEEVAKMEEATIGALPIWRRAFHDWRIPTTLGILLFAGLAILTTWRRSDAMA